MQGTLVPKITLGPFLTLSVRNGARVGFETNFPVIVNIDIGC